MAVVSDRVFRNYTYVEQGASAGLAVIASCLLWIALILAFNVQHAFPKKDIIQTIAIIPVPLEPEVELPPVPKSQKQEVRQQHRENRPLERTVEPAAAPIISPPPIVQLKPIAETPVQIANGGAPTTGSGQAAANGQGQTNLNAQNVITPAIWASEPIYYSPERAAQLKESGSATIRCELLSNRHVRNCRVVNESPKGYGFGRAALAASRDFVINPPKFNGQVIQSSHMDITLNFTR